MGNNNDIKSVEYNVKELSKLLPPGLVPESYIEYLILDNMDIVENQDELMGNVKMQIMEESGIDLLMTRSEAEEYLYSEIDDEKWEAFSQESKISCRQVKMIEDYEDKTILEMIKEMPLIPASRVIGSIICNYLSAHGVEITPENQSDIMEDMIHVMGSSFDDAFSDEDDDDDDFDDDDLDFEWEDGFDPDAQWEGKEIDLDELTKKGDLPDDSEKSDPGMEIPKTRKTRRSRITKFPGKN